MLNGLLQILCQSLGMSISSALYDSQRILLFMFVLFMFPRSSLFEVCIF